MGSARRVRSEGAVALRRRGPRLSPRSPPPRPPPPAPPLSRCPGASAIEAVPCRDADPAGPVGRGHRPLPVRPHLAELGGHRAGADEHGPLVTCSSPGASGPTSGTVAASPVAPRPATPPRAADGTRSGPTLSRSPWRVVHAPGDGVQPRTWRSTTWAGRLHRTRASSVVSLGAWLTPSAGCGTGRSEPSARPSSVATRSPAPAWASRSRSAPAVSSGRTVSVSVPSTGPVSRPSSRTKVVAPVTSSPAMTARCTGAAPRHAGSSEKCRFTQPCTGTSSAARGTSAPYATTGQQSGAIAVRRSRKSGSRGVGGVSTSRPCSSATSLTGEGARVRPRPLRASGRVTTATTSWLEPRRARSEGTAVSGVPARTRRTQRLPNARHAG